MIAARRRVRVGLQVAAVAGRRPVRSRQHMAAVRPTREPSAKIFTAPMPEPVVAEAGADAQVEPGHQVVVGVRAERVQHLRRPSSARPGRRAGPGRLRRVRRRPARPGCAPPSRRRCRPRCTLVTPSFRYCSRGPGDRVGQLGQRVRVDQAAHQELGPFLEQAGGAAAGVGWRPGRRASRWRPRRCRGRPGRRLFTTHMCPEVCRSQTRRPGAARSRASAVAGGRRRACSGRSRSRSTHSPGAVVSARRAIAAYSSSRLPTGGELMSTSPSDMPNPIMWLCASWNPGSTVAAAAGRPRAPRRGGASRPSATDDAAARDGHRGGPRPGRIHGQHVGVDQREVDGHGAASSSVIGVLASR